MASFIHATSLAVTTSLALLLGGCANDGSSTFGSTMFGATTTASIPEKPRTDPACFSLTSQIDALKKEGIAEKVEKAAAKKYKMTAGDLTKAAQLNRSNAEFQAKCSTLTTAMASPAATDAGTAQVVTTPRVQAAVSGSEPVTSGGQ
ncbi:MAG: hypothetical protein ACKVP3_13700 [Hyphomicrobiaceae bacterium]